MKRGIGMKKGDDRRARILETAERLFYEKGYEATSIQDILDAMKLSKGGFYHHFESKMSLLVDICEIRGEEMRQGMADAVSACGGGALEKLNALFSKGGLLQGDDIDFVGMMLSVAYRGEGVLLREKMKQAMIAGALPLLNGIILQGIGEKMFYTRYPEEIGELLLLLFATLSDEIAQIAANQPENVAEALAKLEVYRSSVEMLLGAPYGSVLLFPLERMNNVVLAVLERERQKNPRSGG